MKPSLFAVRMVDHEVAELVRRLHLIKPFVLHETMVPAAQPAGDTLRQIDDYLYAGREALVASALSFRRWLQGPAVEQVRFAAVYRRYVFLRLQIIAALTQLDIFSTAISQRSEVDNGVRLAGLDRLARDALAIEAPPYVAPAMICYLDRGAGAAIRRARTRLPGGGENPVAIIRVRAHCVHLWGLHELPPAHVVAARRARGALAARLAQRPLRCVRLAGVGATRGGVGGSAGAAAGAGDAHTARPGRGWRGAARGHRRSGGWRDAGESVGGTGVESRSAAVAGLASTLGE